MKSDLFLIAGCFLLGVFLSNFTYLIPRYFWLCIIAGSLLAIGLCFPGGGEIARRWSAVAILGGMLVNNWELLTKVTALQFGISAILILVVGAATTVMIGAAGGRNG